MTNSDLKEMIRTAIEHGMHKEHAFLMAHSIIDDAHAAKKQVIDRFKYEINAEEQRRSDGEATN